MSICKEVEEGCNLPSSTNELKILMKQLRREVLKFYNDTTKSLLEHDGKIAELCNYIKNNLNDNLRCLLDSMLESGEIEEIIKQTLFSNVPLSVKDFRSSWGWGA